MAKHLIGDNLVVKIEFGGPHDGSLAWNGNPDPGGIPLFGQSSASGFTSLADLTGIARRVSVDLSNQKIAVKGLGESDMSYRFTNYGGQMQIESFQTTSTGDPITQAGNVVGNYVFVTLIPDVGTTQTWLGVVESFDTSVPSGDVATISMTIDVTPDHSA